MFVIARGTSFTYKGKAVKAKDVAKDSGVRYVLEGSVRRAGNQVRVNAQLIDGENGAHIWSDRFDREIKNTFALQNEITGRIAARLNVALMRAQSRQLKNGPPASLKAWDYALQGYVGLYQLSLDTLGESKALLEKALELDPTLAVAWIGLARMHYRAYRRPAPGISVPHSKKLSLEAAQKAVSLAPASSDAFTMLGQAYRAVNQVDKALISCETAVELNADNSGAYLCLGAAYMHPGKAAKAIGLFEKAQRLNPRHRPFVAHFYTGQAYSLLEQYDKSVRAFTKSFSEFPKHAGVLRGLASSLAEVGRVDEARTILGKYLKVARGKRDTIEKLRAYHKYPPAKFDRLYGGLSRAGMPEK